MSNGTSRSTSGSRSRREPPLRFPRAGVTIPTKSPRRSLGECPVAVCDKRDVDHQFTFPLSKFHCQHETCKSSTRSIWWKFPRQCSARSRVATRTSPKMPSCGGVPNRNNLSQAKGLYEPSFAARPFARLPPRDSSEDGGRPRAGNAESCGPQAHPPSTHLRSRGRPTPRQELNLFVVRTGEAICLSNLAEINATTDARRPGMLSSMSNGSFRLLACSNAGQRCN